MNRRVAMGGLVVLLGALGYWLAPRRPPEPSVRPAPALTREGARPGSRGPADLARPEPGPSPSAGSAAEEKAQRIQKIRHDYEEVRSKAAADYAAAGNDFPGGINGFLRQLALLEREKRRDYAAVLSPAELEDLEYRELPAGLTVQRLLGETAATEEQRRAVFRLQRDFDDRFALVFDVSPPALAEREAARFQAFQAMRTVLGDVLFSQWLQGEGAETTQLLELAAEQGLPPSAGAELWRVKGEFVLRRLELNAAREMPSAQRRAAELALAQQTEIRLIGIVGVGPVQVQRSPAFRWLPRR